MRKLLSLDDLYDFYSKQNQDCKFSAQESDTAIFVHVNEDMTFDDSYDANAYKLKCHLQACHIGENRNRSAIAKEVMEEAIPSFYDAPILGYIHQLKDGSYDFAGHEMEVNEDGEIEYKEIPVGHIPAECNAELKYDAEHDKTYLDVDGYIYKEYTKAAEILTNKKKCKCSVELAIDELEYNVKDKILNIKQFHFTGVTILGTTDDDREREIQEGMEGANIRLSDFSSTMFSQDVLDRVSVLEKQVADLSINYNAGKEEKPMGKFEELLAKYEKTVEDLTFEYEGLTDEELEAKFSEAFEPVAAPTEPDTFAEPAEPAEPAVEKFVKTFELSHDDIRYGLYTLLAQYEEADNEWYYVVKVFDDHFIFQGFWGDKIYGQKYTKTDNAVAFDGDRWDLYAEYLTADEKATVDAMRANYADLQAKAEKLAKYEAEPEKMGLLNSEDYSLVADVDEFVELSKMENHFDLTFDEVKAKADEIILAYAKKNCKPAADGVERTKFAMPAPKKNGRYGSIFAK